MRDGWAASFVAGLYGARANGAIASYPRYVTPLGNVEKTSARSGDGDSTRAGNWWTVNHEAVKEKKLVNSTESREVDASGCSRRSGKSIQARALGGGQAFTQPPSAESLYEGITVHSLLLYVSMDIDDAGNRDADMPIIIH